MLPHRRYIFQILPSDLVARNGKEWGAIHQHNHTSAFLLLHTLVQFAVHENSGFSSLCADGDFTPRGSANFFVSAICMILSLLWPQIVSLKSPSLQEIAFVSAWPQIRCL